MLIKKKKMCMISLCANPVQVDLSNGHLLCVARFSSICYQIAQRITHVDDICCDPNEQILCKIDIPITSLRRSYSIQEHDRKLTEEKFLSVKQ